MGVVSLAGRIVLIVTNIVLLLLSLVMFIIGVIIVTGKDVYNSLVSSLDEELQKSHSQLGTPTVDTSNLTLTEFITPVAYALIALGICIGALSLLGCIGGCYTFRIVLIVYLIAISSVFFVQFIFVMLTYANKSALDGMLKPYIKDTLDDYAGIEGTDASSLSWNALMNYEKCCGVDDYTDFQNLTKWPATINGVLYNLETPVICCITKSTSYTCAESPSVATSYYQIGCYDKLFDMVMDNAFAITMIVFLLGAQFVLIFFTAWILCTMNNTIDII